MCPAPVGLMRRQTHVILLDSQSVGNLERSTVDEEETMLSCQFPPTKTAGFIKIRGWLLPRRCSGRYPLCHPPEEGPVPTWRQRSNPAIPIGGKLAPIVRSAMKLEQRSPAVSPEKYPAAQWVVRSPSETAYGVAANALKLPLSAA